MQLSGIFTVADEREIGRTGVKNDISKGSGTRNMAEDPKRSGKEGNDDIEAAAYARENESHGETEHLAASVGSEEIMKEQAQYGQGCMGSFT